MFLLLLVVTSSFAQIEIRPKNMPMGGNHRNVMDEQGRKQGLWKFYSGDGVLILEITFQNNVKHGPSIKYHPVSGVPIEECTYFNGVKDGDYKSYYRTGELSSDGYYKEGRKTGKWNYYYKVNGEKKSEGEYVSNKKEGVWRFYNSKGKLISEGPYKNNLREGEWKVYDDDGKVIDHIFYVKDVDQRDVKKETKPAKKTK